MELYFENSDKELVKVADIPGDSTTNGAYHLALEAIDKYCKENGIEKCSPHLWRENRDGQPITKFDIGRKAEHFILELTKEIL